MLRTNNIIKYNLCTSFNQHNFYDYWTLCYCYILLLIYSFRRHYFTQYFDINSSKHVYNITDYTPCYLHYNILTYISHEHLLHYWSYTKLFTLHNIIITCTELIKIIIKSLIVIQVSAFMTLVKILINYHINKLSYF